MNNSAAIYIEQTDHQTVANRLAHVLVERGFAPLQLAPTQLDGRMMIPAKRIRHFFVLPASAGWVTIWEDPRYFAERQLAQQLAANLATRAVWIEVSGNSVSWAHGLYADTNTIEECYAEVKGPFYGEYGIVHFVFDIEHPPEDFIAALGLPYADYHYEAVLQGQLPPDAGTPIHLAFGREDAACEMQDEKLELSDA